MTRVETTIVRLHVKNLPAKYYFRREMTSVITEMFDTFGPQRNTFMSVGILLQYFRRKLLQFE